MTVTARLDLAIFDAADIEKVGSFYAELTGWDVVRKDSDRFGVRTPDGQEIEFQRAPDHVAPQWPGHEHPQQFHLDLLVDDLDTGEARALELGASGLNAGGERFRVFTDPADHPFCLIRVEHPGPFESVRGRDNLGRRPTSVAVSEWQGHKACRPSAMRSTTSAGLIVLRAPLHAP